MRNKTGIIPVAVRELLILRKNSFLLLMVFFAPIFYPFLYNSVYTNKMEHDISIVICDHDKSEQSRELIRKLDANEMIKVTDITADENSGLDRIQSLKAMALITIPRNFSKNLKKGKQTKISVEVNNTRFMVASDISRGLTDVIILMSRDIRVSFLQKQGINSTAAQHLADPLVPIVQSLYNTTESYGDFIITALIIIILQQTLLIGVSVSMAMEREEKTFSTLRYLSDNSVIHIIIGKGCCYFFLYSIYAFIYFTIICKIFRLPLNGSVPLLMFFSGVHIVATILLALLIASFFKSKLIVTNICIFSTYPLFMLSGYAWPLQSMPRLIQIFTQCLPSTVFFKVYFQLSHMDCTFTDVLPSFYQMVIIVGILFTILFHRFSVLVKKDKMIKYSGTISLQ